MLRFLRRRKDTWSTNARRERMFGFWRKLFPQRSPNRRRQKSKWREVVQRCGWILWMPIALLLAAFWTVVAILAAWWNTRAFHYLLRGAPALAIGGLSAYLASASLLETPGVRENAYIAAAEDAARRGSYKAARIYYERAIELRGSSPTVLFELAKACQQTGDYPRMAAIIQSIAPEEGYGYAPAHLWLATHLLTKDKRTDADVSRAELHLRKTVDLRANDVNAHNLLGQLYFGVGLWDEAIEHYDQVRQTIPAVNLQIAKAYAIKGDVRQAQRYGIAAQTHFRQRFEKDAADVQSLVGLAEATMFLEQHEAAVGLLEQALRLRDEPRIRTAIARTYVAWAESLEKVGANKFEKRPFELLSRALRFDPNEPLLLESMLRYVSSESDSLEEVRGFLRDNIVAGNAVGTSHLLLAVAAYSIDRNLDQAKFHLERAIELMPNAPIVANNFAWVLSTSEPPELDRALRVIDPIVEKFPEAHRFRDTRGQIFVKLGNWRRGIDDLERALPAMAENAETHLALAQAYDQLGITDLADEHRQAAQRISKK